MSQPLLSRPPLDRTRSPGRVKTRDDVSPLITSQAFDWPGVLLEAGRNDIAQVQDLTLAHHYIGVNADARPLTLEVKEAHGSRAIPLPPGSVWVLPAGDPVTLRVDTLCTYIRLTLEPQHLNGLLARSRDEEKSVELRRAYGIATPQLTHVLKALVAEADLGNPGGFAFVETLTAAVGQQLALHAGVERPRPQPARGGLSAVARRRALKLIDAKLDANLTIEMLAREVGLSPAHFARAFKETIGHPPHRYLLSLRLQRARRMLEAPAAVLSDVALRTGFADQAHFTRLFRREFGVTPGTVLRARRR